MSNNIPKHWGLELDRQVRIFEAALDEDMYIISNRLQQEHHPEGRFVEADKTAGVAERYDLEPEDMPEVFDKHIGLKGQGLI